MAERDKMEVLQEAAALLGEAAETYWRAAHRAGIPGAVVWLSFADHRLVIVTRGEYRDTLMANIERMGAPVFFGGAGAPEALLE